jgi:hypothetical protein
MNKAKLNGLERQKRLHAHGKDHANHSPGGILAELAHKAEHAVGHAVDDVLHHPEHFMHHGSGSGDMGDPALLAKVQLLELENSELREKVRPSFPTTSPLLSSSPLPPLCLPCVRPHLSFCVFLLLPPLTRCGYSSLSARMMC